MEAMKALALCICTGRWIIHEVRASGAEAVAWLEEFEGATRSSYANSARIAAAWAGAEASAIRLGLSLRSHRDRAEVTARIDGRELVLANAREPPVNHGSGLRRTTVEETFTLAARWLFGHERHGCADPLADAFWYERAQVASYMMEEPDASALAKTDPVALTRIDPHADRGFSAPASSSRPVRPGWCRGGAGASAAPSA